MQPIRDSSQNVQTAHAVQYKKHTTQFKKKWAEDLIDISPKDTYRWWKSTWKHAPHYKLLGKDKSKLQ